MIIKETWIAKIKEIGFWTEELFTYCPFSPISAWSYTGSKFCQACLIETVSIAKMTVFAKEILYASLSTEV